MKHSFKKGHHVRWLIHYGRVIASTPGSVRVEFYTEDGHTAWMRPKDLILVCKFCKRTEGEVKSILIWEKEKKGHDRYISAHEHCFVEWAKTVLKKVEEREARNVQFKNADA